jgi:sugar transferase (PEP-CTERM/EpsH1 system associated)
MRERKIKILHVIDSLDIGGMERVVIDLANGLDAAKFEQIVCCLSRRGEAANELRDDVRCIDLGKGERADRWMPWKLARIIRRERPDLVHSQSWSGVDTALAMAFAPGVRLVHSEHGRNFHDLHGQSLARRIARRWLYQRANAVFAISAEVREFYCRQTNFPLERMQVIPNGVDLRRIDAADGNGVREELGIKPEEFVIGTVARLDKNKDTMTLARAFAELTTINTGAALKLLIVGDGEQRAALEQFVSERGLNRNVIFAGMRRDVPRVLKAMNVFALSSLSEGMPMTVLEAMAARLPTVATAVGALPEMVEEGKTGFLLSVGDAATMAERLHQLMLDRQLAKTFGEAARRKVERNFTLERMLQRYAELYVSVLKS